MKTRILLIVAAALALAGCQNIAGYKAEEVHHSISFPLIFTDAIHAVGIKQETDGAGVTVTRAETLTHETTIGGFTRTATYKGAEISIKK